MKTNCIICEKQVENWDIAYPEGSNQVHPIGGTVFRTYGHYGSGVFDPMDATYLEVVFCDDCLKEKLRLTYKGENKEYKQLLDNERDEQNALLDIVLDSRASEAEKQARIWKMNDERNKNT